VGIWGFGDKKNNKNANFFHSFAPQWPTFQQVFTKFTNFIHTTVIHKLFKFGACRCTNHTYSPKTTMREKKFNFRGPLAPKLLVGWRILFGVRRGKKERTLVFCLSVRHALMTRAWSDRGPGASTTYIVAVCKPISTGLTSFLRGWKGRSNDVLRR